MARSLMSNSIAQQGQATRRGQCVSHYGLDPPYRIFKLNICGILVVASYIKFVSLLCCESGKPLAAMIRIELINQVNKGNHDFIYEFSGT